VSKPKRIARDYLLQAQAECEAYGTRLTQQRVEQAMEAFAAAAVADLERKLSETYASRSALDCQYAGAHGESDGASHCPPEKPCQRCLLERERDGLIQASAGFIRAWETAERERDEARAEVERLHKELGLYHRALQTTGQCRDEALRALYARKAADGGEGER
jgi:hypothetical protein